MPKPRTHYKTLRRSRTIPWGYQPCSFDEDILEPVPELMELLDTAERAWKARTASQDDIARWLTHKASLLGYNLPISKLGLRIRLFKTPKNIDRFALRVNDKAIKAYSRGNRPSKALKAESRSKKAGQPKAATKAQRTAKAS